MYIIKQRTATEGLDRLDDNSVQLIFLDPPWLAGDRKMGEYEYKDSFLPNEYHEKIVIQTVRRAEKKLKYGGTLAVWVDYRAAPYWGISLDCSTILNRNGEVIVESLLGNPGKSKWPVKHSNIILASRGEPSFDASAMPTVARRSAAKPGYEGEKRVGSVLQGTMSNTDPQRVGYPDQKPIDIATIIIKTHTKEGDIVVDPFCGSGTIPLAAHLSGRVGVGYDISEKAVALALSRCPPE